MSLILQRSRSPFASYADIRQLWQELEEDLTPGLLADVYETEDAVVVETAIAGIKPEDIKLSITEDVLTVSGESQPAAIEGKNFHRKEMRYGRFSESIVLPVSVQADKIEAQFNHGVLTVTLPKAEEVKPKQIEIKVGNK